MDSVPDFISCQQLRFISYTLDFGNRMYTDILQKEKICTLESLMCKERRLKLLQSKAKDPRIKKYYQQLVDIILYVGHLRTLDHSNVYIDGELFKEGEFEHFCENQNKIQARSLDSFCFGGGGRGSDDETSHEFREDEAKSFIKKMVPEALDKVEPTCKGMLTKCKFPIEEFTNTLLSSRRKGTKFVVVEGRTQLGKSNVKCLVHGVGSAAKAGVIVITKGNRERDELRNKIKSQVTNRYSVLSANSSANGIADLLKSHGSVVTAQTFSQIDRKLIEAVRKCQREDPNFRFIVVLDEGDTMFRSREGDTHVVKVESAYRELLKLSPMVVVMISATVVPMLLHVADKAELEQNASAVRFFQWKPHDDYVSVEHIAPLQDEDREDAFLDKTIRFNGGGGFRIGRKSIPFTDVEGKITALYDIALAHCMMDQSDEHSVASSYESPGYDTDIELLNPPSKKMKQQRKRGILLLDITNNDRVYAEGNVCQRAERVQKDYYSQQWKANCCNYHTSKLRWQRNFRW